MIALSGAVRLSDPVSPEPHVSSSSLSALGIPPLVEAAYRRLLAGEGPLTDAEKIGVVDHGLARWEGERCMPVSIDLAWTAWRARHAQDQADAQAAVGAFLPLYEAYLTRDAAHGFVEVLRGHEAVERKTAELFAQTRHSVDELIRPPFYHGPTSLAMPEEQQLLSPDVAVRGLYKSSLLSYQYVMDAVRASIAHGEQARVRADVPLRMRIHDQTWAMVTLAQPPTDAAGMQMADYDALLITRSPFLDALVRLFETFWNQSTPLVFDLADSDADGRLLAYMEAGLTDAAIGLSLGVSERTVHRRISALMVAHGAATRFQLGMAAERRRSERAVS